MVSVNDPIGWLPPEPVAVTPVGIRPSKAGASDPRGVSPTASLPGPAAVNRCVRLCRTGSVDPGGWQPSSTGDSGFMSVRPARTSDAYPEIAISALIIIGSYLFGLRHAKLHEFICFME